MSDGKHENEKGLIHRSLAILSWPFTNLRDAFLAASDLSAALLVGTQLKDSKDLTDEMLEQAFGDVNTPLPYGLTRPASWGSREDAIKKWQAFCEEERHRFRQSMGSSNEGMSRLFGEGLSQL